MSMKIQMKATQQDLDLSDWPKFQKLKTYSCNRLWKQGHLGVSLGSINWHKLQWAT